MFAIGNLDIKKIVLGKPSVAFEKDNIANSTMRFVKVQYPSRPPTITFTATVAECYEGDYGLICEVKPETSEFHLFEALENLLELKGETHEFARAQVGWIDGKYEHRPTLSDTYHLRLKMDFEKMKFKTSVKDAEEAMEYFKEGMKVVVKVTPGFYFNDTDHRYGLYYSLKSILKE